MKNEIKKTVKDISDILSSNDEDEWAKTFEKLSSGLDSEYELSLNALKRLYGGMGSFNDIVLHKNGMPLIHENEELDDLRHMLYKQLTAAINTL